MTSSNTLKRFVVERRTESGKSWSKVAVGSGKTISRALDILLAAGRSDGGTFRIRDTNLSVTIFSRTFATPAPIKLTMVGSRLDNARKVSA